MDTKKASTKCNILTHISHTTLKLSQNIKFQIINNRLNISILWMSIVTDPPIQSHFVAGNNIECFFCKQSVCFSLLFWSQVHRLTILTWTLYRWRTWKCFLVPFTAIFDNLNTKHQVLVKHIQNVIHNYNYTCPHITTTATVTMAIFQTNLG